ncbi:expressed unknown protein [Seminavis robusta]|uniref:Uncharacterized protein n=1 Tax=Seminavis robusta TaxID=568900 RepID=A0A9N8EB70_9STRA|nr:expressed unknown protein [Seminavis robusta]|eukprot:Sro836_g208990.1 n/a (180) ;mRNA; r:23023-23562
MANETDCTDAPTSAPSSAYYPGRLLIDVDEDASNSFPRRRLSGTGSARGGMGSGGMMGGSMMGMMSMTIETNTTETNATDAPTSPPMSMGKKKGTKKGEEKDGKMKDGKMKMAAKKDGKMKMAAKKYSPYNETVADGNATDASDMGGPMLRRGLSIVEVDEEEDSMTTKKGAGMMMRLR